MAKKHTTDARTIERTLKKGTSTLRKSIVKPIHRMAKQNAVTGLIGSKPAPMLLKNVRSNIHPMKLNRLTQKTNRREIQIRRESELGLLNICGLSHFL
jgi:hypothetical protein